MIEQYKNKMEQIHVPEELILKTQEKLRHKNKMRKIWGGLSAAAVLVIFIGTAFWYEQNIYTNVDIQLIVFENEITVGMNAGINDIEDKDIIKEDYLAVGDKLKKAQKIMGQITPSIISGREVYVGYEEKTETFYAVYQKEDKMYLVEDEEKTKEEFISFLKNIM